MDDNEQLHLARQILDRDFAAPITIAQLSHDVALSPYYLIRLFRRSYKQTPHQYVMQLRINKAKDLLVNTDLTVTEICVDVGYESLGSFSALFCKMVGLPPSVYRANSNRTHHNATYIPLCTCLFHGIDDPAD